MVENGFRGADFVECCLYTAVDNVERDKQQSFTERYEQRVNNAEGERQFYCSYSSEVYFAVHFYFASEFGDILFAAVNIARWNNIDAEQALIKANKKFIKRFRKMEELAVKPLNEYTLEEYTLLWNSAKKELEKDEYSSI